ncbi:LysR family transcriptional regulator [Actinomadura sp. B10D3]|uniref:helix-turn-helix domain-containing protein n=1 Tax=Actinomadura sp. B10D3 TaxID=3153557 RepID=UPI00325F2E09
MLDLGRLRVLRELKLRGTLAAVADALGYTPSAVSQQLAQLQRDVGVPVVERAGRRLRLTEAGEVLAEREEGIVVRDIADAPVDRRMVPWTRVGWR